MSDFNLSLRAGRVRMIDISQEREHALGLYPPLPFPLPPFSSPLLASALPLLLCSLFPSLASSLLPLLPLLPSPLSSTSSLFSQNPLPTLVKLPAVSKTLRLCLKSQNLVLQIDLAAVSELTDSNFHPRLRSPLSV